MRSGAAIVGAAVWGMIGAETQFPTLESEIIA